MEKSNFGYSLKNISTSDDKCYKMQVLEKTEIFIKKMRWRPIFFFNNKKATEDYNKVLVMV